MFVEIIPHLIVSIAFTLLFRGTTIITRIGVSQMIILRHARILIILSFVEVKLNIPEGVGRLLRRGIKNRFLQQTSGTPAAGVV